MNKSYRILLISLLCLLLAVPATAADMARVEVPERSLRPLGGGAPLACCETTIYENLTGDLFVLDHAIRYNLMDDGAFPAGTAPVDVHCVMYGWHHPVEESLIIVLDFWDTLVPGGPACNLSHLGQFIADYGTVGVGNWYSEVVLPNPIVFPDDNWAVQISFWRSHDPWTPSSRATVLFRGDGPTVGSNDGDVFYWDSDESLTFECPGEAVTFGEGSDHFLLKLGTSLGPSATEPANWGTIKALYR